MNRVLILGCPGSGKSTFARQLGALTGLPLVHLDNVYWRPDGTHLSRPAFDEALLRLLREEQWILDGNYSRTYEVRISACDTVFFLDYDTKVCLAGVAQRVGRPRPDMPWTEERPDPELIDLIRRYPEEERPRLLAILARYPQKSLIRFETRGQAQAWLESNFPKEEPPWKR